MKTTRLLIASLLFVGSSLLLLIALGALHPRMDVARMLLAANGSLMRGFAGVSVVGALMAWLAEAMPGLVVASRAIGVLAVVAGAVNMATWMVGLDRRDVSSCRKVHDSRAP